MNVQRINKRPSISESHCHLGLVLACNTVCTDHQRTKLMLVSAGISCRANNVSLPKRCEAVYWRCGVGSCPELLLREDVRHCSWPADNALDPHRSHTRHGRVPRSIPAEPLRASAVRPSRSKQVTLPSILPHWEGSLTENSKHRYRANLLVF